MATIKFMDNEAHTVGALPEKGHRVKITNLVNKDMKESSLSDFKGKKKILSFFPSVDTSVCAASVRHFNKSASQLKDTVVLNISLDLPFALERFCAAEGIDNCETLSGFRSEVGKDFGLTLVDTPMKGLYSRAIVVLSENDEVIHTELVSDIAKEPNYDMALKSIS